MSERREAKRAKKTEEDARRGKRRIIIYSLICAALIIYVFIKQGAFSGKSAAEIMTIACDACFVCGLLLGGLFVLSLCYYHGAFDFIMYGVRVVIDTLFRSDGDRSGMFTDFATYLRQNSENRRLSKTSLVFAAAFILAGCVFLVLYYAVK